MADFCFHGETWMRSAARATPNYLRLPESRFGPVDPGHLSRRTDQEHNGVILSINQNKLYSFVNGSDVAGSISASTPSACTAYVSGLTVILGIDAFHFMSFFFTERHPFTASNLLESL
jgi:hypothetical protein